MPRLAADTYNPGFDDPSSADTSTPDMIADNLKNGFLGIQRFKAIQEAKDEEGNVQSGSSIARFGYLPQGDVAPTPLMSKQEADKRIKASGLTGRLTVPDSGIRALALDDLLEAKHAEITHDFTQANFHGGVMAGLGQMGTELAVGMTDPVNLAASFIPVVGEARTARMLEMAGASFIKRAGVRAAIGAADAGVGMTAIEPLNYYAAKQLQADYSTDDSLRNVLFGTGMGMLLHTGVGGLADLYAKSTRTGAWQESPVHLPDGTTEVPRGDLPYDAVVASGSWTAKTTCAGNSPL
jgi:hypothetical protein